MVQPVSRSDGYRQRIDASSGDKLARGGRIGEEAVGGVDNQVILLAPEAAQLCLNAGAVAVAQCDGLSHFGDVLFERQM